jgi:asparagine synthase (glutamine-hydrolysing)
MCGFVAVVDTTRGLTPELLIDMREALVHRGPDEEGVWLSRDGSVGFGHRRLSIIDLVAGQQPMSNEDGTVVLAYNGEVYNHQALRAELERYGRRFRTRCDTEVVLAAYERYGDECLSRLDGMFAFAIWDARRRRLFFARDRAGEKPLYYAATGSGWVMASEIKALLRHPDVRRAVDVEALSYYLSFLTTPPPNTLFDGISKVPAAHCGSWSEAEGLRTWRWWNLPGREPMIGLSEDDAAAQLHDLFAASVEERMMSDVPIGVYLSGGVDSSANVAFMCRHSSGPLRTFSIAFADEPSLNELAQARRVAAYFGTDHSELVLKDDDVVACLPSLVHHQDEPIADPVCVPLFHLARLTKRSGVTVVQIGEGSDESFFGYPAYTQIFRGTQALQRTERIVPRPLLRAAVEGLAPFMGEHRYELMREALKRGVPAPHGIAGFSERHKRRLLVTNNGGGSAFDYLESRFGSARTLDGVASVGLAHEFGLRMPELLLMRIDKMTMASSVEARAPFLDPQLVEFAARLPLSFHWANGAGKRILKRAFGGVVPEFVLARPKQGFGAPVWRWLSSMRTIGEQELLREPIFELLDRGALRQLLDGNQTSRQGFEFWILLNFALWHRHWIEGADLRELQSFPPSLSKDALVAATAEASSEST